MESLTSYLAAAAAGLLGGVHCAGMCGALVASVTRPLHARRVMLMNLARIASYVAAGLIAASLGHAGFALGDSTLALTVWAGLSALVLIVMGLSLAGWRPVVRILEGMGAHLWQRLAPYARGLLPVNSTVRAVKFGLLWGWTPCAMVYSALLLALTRADALQGALVMASFGLGTLPNLSAIAFLGDRLRAAGGMARARQLAGGLVGAFGVWQLVSIAHSHQHALALAR